MQGDIMQREGKGVSGLMTRLIDDRPTVIARNALILERGSVQRVWSLNTHQWPDVAHSLQGFNGYVIITTLTVSA